MVSPFQREADLKVGLYGACLRSSIAPRGILRRPRELWIAHDDERYRQRIENSNVSISVRGFGQCRSLAVMSTSTEVWAGRIHGFKQNYSRLDGTGRRRNPVR